LGDRGDVEGGAGGLFVVYESQGASIMSGLFEIFLSPGKVFERVRETGMFLPAFLAVILLAVGNYAVMVNLIGAENMARQQIERNPRMVQQLGPEGVERAVAQAGTPARAVISYVAVVVVSCLLLLVVAGICLAGLSMTGSSPGFKRVLGAVSYAWFPFSLLNLCMSALIISLAPDRNALDIRNLTATNIGAFLDSATTSKAMMSIANSIDVISFALIAFLGYGLSKVSGSSFVKCTMIVVALWVVYVLCKTGLSSIF
jgi:hypothetical protein